MAMAGLERQDWMEGFRHQLRRGHIQEASRMLHYLSFSELAQLSPISRSASLLEKAVQTQSFSRHSSRSGGQEAVHRARRSVGGAQRPDAGTG